jgi:hypothetical protein
MGRWTLTIVRRLIAARSARSMKLLSLIAVVAFAISLGACGSATHGNATTSTARPGDPPRRLEGLVLKVVAGGGLAPPDAGFVEALPEVAVFADGRIFTVDPASADVFSSATMVVLKVRHVPVATVNRIVVLAQTAGFTTPPPDWGQPMVTDLATTSITLVTFGRARTLSVYALGFKEGAGLTSGQLAARRRLEALLNMLQRFGATLGPGYPARVYRPSSLSVYALSLGTAPVSASGALRWPLHDLRPLGRYQSQCAGVSGASEVKRVLRLAATASPDNVWVSAGHGWHLIFRPDLPGTRPCG